MSLVDALRYRLRVLLRPDSYGRELEEEIEHHLDLETRQQQRVVRTLGRATNVTYVNEERRIVSGLAIADGLRQDVRFVVRVLLRRRVFAAVTVATLALGIGAATSIFSIADVVLFRPLNFPDADRLITVWQTRPELKTNPVRAGQWDRGGVSMPAFRAWRPAQTSFDDIGGYTTSSTIVGGADGAEELTIMHATASLLPVLRVQPEIGRGFTAAEDAVGGERVALMSHEVWVSRFAATPRVIGRRVAIDSVSYSIIGVLPAGLTLDRRTAPAAFWVPAGQNAEDAQDAGASNYWVIGRLKHGVGLGAAITETEQFVKTWASIGSGPRGVRLTSLKDEQTQKVRAPILILLAASALLLLIACANVATVLMGEATTRDRELNARMALGASRGRLVRQLLTESVLLALVSGALGALLAYGGTKIIVRLAPPWIPGLADVRVDVRVLMVALAVSCLTGLLFGIVPAMLLTRSAGRRGLRVGGHSGRGRGQSQRVLVACEVALSMVLLVGAALLVESFTRINAVDPGFRSDQLYVVRLRLPRPQYADTIRLRAVYADLVSRVRTLPGVTAVAATTAPPFSGGSSSSSFDVEGAVRARGARGPEAQRRVTTPDYFATAGIPLIDGRSYSDADRIDTPPVVVVSRSLARREWPNESALGKRIKWIGEWRTVVGVVGDIKLHDLFEEMTPTVYAPLAQLVTRGDPSLVVRTRPGADDVPAAVRGIVRDIAPGVPVSSIDAMHSMVAATLADERFRTELIALFAGIAAVLAAVGMYGVAATTASRRTQEMAIRAALGAPNASIVGLIVRAGASGVALGAVVGVGLALIGTRALVPYLHGTGTANPLTYLSVLVLLTLTTLAATWIPARRATRIPLVDTLRGE